MLVGVLSDTHIPSRARGLPDSLHSIFDGVDMILHAGDVVERSVLDELSVIAPVQGVLGNCDPFELRALLPHDQQITIGNIGVGMIHDSGLGPERRKRMREAFPGCRVVVYGHSHNPLIEDDGELLLLNPGTPTDPRWGSDLRTVALLEVDGERVKARLVVVES